MKDVQRARLERRAEDCRSDRGGVIGLEDDRSCGRGQRVEPERDAHDQGERPARPADELAEVVPGDVLDDLAARVRDGSVGEHERDAEHEITRSTEPVPQRA